MFAALHRMLFGGRTRTAPADQWGSLAAAEGHAVPYSPGAAESLSAVVGCTELICSSVAALPVHVWRTTPAGREKVPTNPLQRLIDAGPSRLLDWHSWVVNTVADILLRGNSFSALRVNAGGALSGLDFYPWRSVAAQVNTNGRMLYMATPPYGGTTQRFIAGEVLHVRGRSDDGGYFGRSVLSRGAGAVSSAVLTQKYGAQFFANQSRPSGALQAPGRLSKETTQRLKEDFETNYSAERLGRLAVLPEGLTFNAISLSPEEAEMLETRKYGVHEICRLFSVPAALLNQGDKAATFASAKEATRWFARGCLVPLCAKLEDAIARACLPPGLEVEFDLGQLLRGDAEARWQTYSVARQTGVLSINEIRSAEGFNTLPDPVADSHEPLGMSGKPPDSGAAPSDGKDVIDIDRVRTLLRQRLARRAA